MQVEIKSMCSEKVPPKREFYVNSRLLDILEDENEVFDQTKSIPNIQEVHRLFKYKNSKTLTEHFNVPICLGKIKDLL